MPDNEINALSAPSFPLLSLRDCWCSGLPRGFELAAPTQFVLVVFSLKASDEANEELRYRFYLMRLRKEYTQSTIFTDLQLTLDAKKCSSNLGWGKR